MTVATYQAATGAGTALAGELDAQNLIPAAEIAWMRHNIPRALQLRTYLGVNYLTTNFQHKPFRDWRLREAIALAYDRETIADKILRIGDQPALVFEKVENLGESRSF